MDSIDPKLSVTYYHYVLTFGANISKIHVE